ncbi:MAG: coenzyme F420 hydrogenase [Planctomycetes bacterium]|nr:coenzyme F420 hydrogenase [Planctomycetota bacterium]
MIDDVEHGRRPRPRHGACAPGKGSEAMRVCPGIAVEHTFDERHPGLIGALRREWGPVLEVWEGHAADPEIRHEASSGGAATALALAGIETAGMHGVLHIRARRDAPLLNETVLSTSRREVVEAVGSRYAPASPCDGLGLVERAPAPCVFIGKPCDVAAVQRALPVRPALRGRIGVTIAVFCAGTPTTRATLNLLERIGVDDPRDVVDVRYRGRGWPGRLAVRVRTERGTETRSLPYEETWGALTGGKQWRCQVCADHTGELADIAVGDPWHRPISKGEPGRSIILVRTERGRQVLRRAVRDGYLAVERVDPANLTRSQPDLLRTRGATWGRLLACRVLGVPVPRYRGFPMFRTWLTKLSVRERLRSLAGTVKRIHRRGLRERAVVVESPVIAALPPEHRETPTRREAA